MLLHVLDGTSPDPVGDYKAIQLELELFNPALLDKPQVRMHTLTPQPMSSLLALPHVDISIDLGGVAVCADVFEVQMLHSPTA